MANATSSSGTAYANLDWIQYTLYRPAYPPSLRELIYRYHTRHNLADSAAPGLSSHWDSLLDIGAGIGVSSVPFIGDFRTVRLFDPSPLNHEKAQVFLAEHVAAQKLTTKLEFTVGKAEDYASKRVSSEDSGASLAICATTAHFIEPTMLVKAMHENMRPGGTMAIYSYWNPVFPDLDSTLSLAFGKAVITAMRLCVRDETTRTVFVDVAARLCAGTAVLDAIAVPDGLFEHVQRIQINPQANVAMDVYREDPPVPCVPMASQIGKHEQKLVYVEGQDAEAEGWSRSVDLDHLHGVIKTILPAGLELTGEQHEALYGELDRVFAAECPSGSTRAMYGLNVILATKRESPMQDA